MSFRPSIMRSCPLVLAALLPVLFWCSVATAQEPTPASSSSKDAFAQLRKSIQGTWVRESMNNEGQWIRREKVIAGNKETITDYNHNNEVLRSWSVDFTLDRFAGKYNVFRVGNGAYIFDVDDNYWYEVHDLKRARSMLPTFRRKKPIANLNENTLDGIENWVGTWRGQFEPKALAGYGNVPDGPVQVDFKAAKDALGTTMVWSWIESSVKTGKVIASVHGFVGWSPQKNSLVVQYINSSGANVSGTVSPRGRVCVLDRVGSGAEGGFSGVCIREFPAAGTLVHKIINRVHNGKNGPDAVPVTLKRVKQKQ